MKILNINLQILEIFCIIFILGIWHINGGKVCTNLTGYLLVLCLIENSRLKAFLVHPGADGINYTKNFVTFRKTPGKFNYILLYLFFMYPSHSKVGREILGT